MWVHVFYRHSYCTRKVPDSLTDTSRYIFNQPTLSFAPDEVEEKKWAGRNRCSQSSKLDKTN